MKALDFIKRLRCPKEEIDTAPTVGKYWQLGGQGQQLDVSPIIGLPTKFKVMGEDYCIDDLSDIKRFPMNFSSFDINGTKIYFNNYFRLCADAYEKKGQRRISNALREKANELESHSVYGRFLRGEANNVRSLDELLPKSTTATLAEITRSVYEKDDIDTEQIIKDEQRWIREQRGISPVDAELFEIDNMDGHEFERWCANLLEENGFTNVEVTPGSNDQGVDVLAEKSGIKYAVQCKCYSSDLGNTPVQEVTTGKYVYRCHIGAVMTNRYFTAGAKEAAEATGTLLWDRDTIREMLKGYVE